MEPEKQLFIPVTRKVEKVMLRNLMRSTKSPFKKRADNAKKILAELGKNKKV